jgi:DNA-binding transcriptional LysR family regulator
LLGQLTSAFDLIEAACAELRPRDPAPVLAVHCAPSFAAKWLGPRLSAFMREHASITLRLSSGAEPVDLQRHDEVHVDISYGVPPHRPGVCAEPLGLEDTVPLCAPRLIADRPPPGPAELTGYTLIDSQLNPVQWPQWCRLHGLALPAQSRPSFDRASLAVAAAVDGLGVALESRRFAEAELAQGTLVALDGPGFQPIRGEIHFLCYREAQRDLPTVRSFRAWIRAQAGVPLP